MPFQGQTRTTYVTPNTGEVLGQVFSDFIKKKKQDKEDKEAQSVAEQLVKRMQGQEQKGGPLLSQEGQDYQQFEPAVAPDPFGAAMDAATNPRTMNNPTIQALMKQRLGNQAKSTQGGRGAYFTYETDKNGNLWKLDARGDAQPEMVRDSKGQTIQPAKYDPTRLGDIKGAQEQGKKDVQLEMDPQIDAATKQAVHQVQKGIDRPKWDSKLASAKDRREFIKTKIDQINDDASWMSTGLANQMTGWIAGTPARDMNLNLTTLKAIAGFTELRDLKDAGGTLGQVSNTENELLQAVWGNVEASQGPDQFKQNLALFREQVDKSWKRINDAYERQYGGETKNIDETPPPQGITQQEWNAMPPEDRALWK